MSWPEPTTNDGIYGDRRYDRRYEIALELRWRLVRRRKVLDSGVGSTIDLSSGGVLFEAGRALPVGLSVELSIAWPALLHNVAAMQLSVAGRIVRTHGTRIAISMSQHEFRTAGMPGEIKQPPPARPPSVYARPSSPGKFGTFQ
jgi:hypothetical protein